MWHINHSKPLIQKVYSLTWQIILWEQKTEINIGISLLCMETGNSKRISQMHRGPCCAGSSAAHSSPVSQQTKRRRGKEQIWGGRNQTPTECSTSCVFTVLNPAGAGHPHPLEHSRTHSPGYAYTTYHCQMLQNTLQAGIYTKWPLCHCSSLWCCICLRFLEFWYIFYFKCCSYGLNFIYRIGEYVSHLQKLNLSGKLNLDLKKKNSMIVNFANSHMAFKIIYAIILTWAIIAWYFTFCLGLSPLKLEKDIFYNVLLFEFIVSSCSGKIMVTLL